jgi:radical SAM protein with 4Fe4S-binding SPASM domain
VSELISSRIDAITRISAEYLGEVLPAPRSVKLELTATCNYKCTFCTKSQHPSEGHMDGALYTRIIQELRDAGVEELGLFYIGESFTCKWLPDAIAEAKQCGFPYVFLTTNGSAATPERLKACMDAGLDSLKFSMNFYSAKQLAEVAQVSPHYWRKAIENLKIARAIRDDNGYPCRLYASSIALDGAQGEQMKAVVAEIRPYVDEHYWLPLYGMGGASKAAGWTPKPGNPGRLDAMRDPLPCWSVFTEGHITKDGKLSACCFGGGDSMVMGDLTTTPFMEAWNSLEYQQLRKAHLAKDVRGTPCEECAL